MPLFFVLQVFTVSSNLNSNPSRYLLPSGDLQGSRLKLEGHQQNGLHSIYCYQTLLHGNSLISNHWYIKKAPMGWGKNLGKPHKLYSYSISCHYLTSSFMIRLTCSLPILKVCTSCILLEYQISVRGYASASPKRDRKVSAFLWIYNPSLAWAIQT